MNRWLIGLLTLLVILCSCDGDKKKSETKTESDKNSKKIETKPLAELFTHSSPQLPERFNQATLMSDLDKAHEAIPEIGNAKYKELKLDEYGVIASLEFGFTADPFPYLGLKFKNAPFDETEAALTAKWGAPETIEVVNPYKEKNSKKIIKTWFNPKQGIRAILEPLKSSKKSKLRVGIYTPLEALVVRDKNFGLKETPLLGANLKNLRKIFGSNLKEHESMGKKQASIHIAPIRFYDDTTSVKLFLKEETVVGFEFWIDAWIGEQDTLIGLYKKQFGEGTVNQFNKTKITFSEDPQIITEWRAHNHRLIITVGEKVSPF